VFNLLDEIFKNVYKNIHLTSYHWHDDTPKYIKKRQQGIVLPHEVKRSNRMDMVKNVPLLHRKISPLGKRSKKIWETWYLVM